MRWPWNKKPEHRDADPSWSALIPSGTAAGIPVSPGNAETISTVFSCVQSIAETIGGLQDMAKKVSQLVASVDEALREQASASNDVAKKVEDVAAQAEEATAIAKQTSSAANTMTQTAHAMEQLVARFRI